jgi:Holliday junction resolvasome RuvABC endonuclease subunit
MRIIGIDPGVSGAVAVIEIVGDTMPVLVGAIDVPIIGTKARARADVLQLRNWIVAHHPDQAAIERVGAMPAQGRSSIFRFARTTGALEAVVTLLEIPCTTLEPSVWKRTVGLLGAARDKESSRQRALALFPSAHICSAANGITTLPKPH